MNSNALMLVIIDFDYYWYSRLGKGDFFKILMIF